MKTLVQIEDIKKGIQKSIDNYRKEFPPEVNEQAKAFLGEMLKLCDIIQALDGTPQPGDVISGILGSVLMAGVTGDKDMLTILAKGSEMAVRRQIGKVLMGGE